MDHLPFEAMLFDPPQAGSEEQAALKEHLANCRGCRDLASALEPMENHMRKLSTVVPVDGFTQRFQGRLSFKRRKAQERILAVAILAIAVSLVAVGILFGGELLSAMAPLVTSGLKSLGQLLRIGSMLGLLGDFLSVLVESAVGNLSPAYLLAISFAFSGLLSLWVFSLYRFNYQSIRRE
jgi:predicted anti-sigma-YlaC factor YlaD